MPQDHISAIEAEALAFSRHLSAILGRKRTDDVMLDQSAYTLLSIIAMGGPASIGTLSSITGLDVSTLNRQTAALVRDGHAERIADPMGGMARVFRITLVGRMALEFVQERNRGLVSATLENWSDRERAELARVLRRFNESVEQHRERTWPRAN